MDALLDQLPALIGVVVGAVATIGAGAVTETARWRRGQRVRWDERRMDSYAEYARALKAIHALCFRLTADRRPGSVAPPMDPTKGLALLADAERHRTTTWEGVLLLGDAATVAAARVWRGSVRELELIARGLLDLDGWDAAVQAADEGRDRFYAAARASLAIAGGTVAQSGWLHPAERS